MIIIIVCLVVVAGRLDWLLFVLLGYCSCVEVWKSLELTAEVRTIFLLFFGVFLYHFLLLTCLLRCCVVM